MLRSAQHDNEGRLASRQQLGLIYGGISGRQAEAEINCSGGETCGGVDNRPCIDQGPVQVIVTGSSCPRNDCPDSTKTSLLVGVRPFQRPRTSSSKSTSTVCPR